MNKKFAATVTTTHEIEIEINTDIINDTVLQEFSQYMWKVDGYADLVRHIALREVYASGSSVIEGVCLRPKHFNREDNLNDCGVHVETIYDEDEVEVCTIESEDE